MYLFVFANKLTCLNFKKWVVGRSDDLTPKFTVLSYSNSFYIISNTSMLSCLFLFFDIIPTTNVASARELR